MRLCVCFANEYVAVAASAGAVPATQAEGKDSSVTALF